MNKDYRFTINFNKSKYEKLHSVLGSIKESFKEYNESTLDWKEVKRMKPIKHKYGYNEVEFVLMNMNNDEISDIVKKIKTVVCNNVITAYEQGKYIESICAGYKHHEGQIVLMGNNEGKLTTADYNSELIELTNKGYNEIETFNDIEYFYMCDGMSIEDLISVLYLKDFYIF